MNLFFIAPDDIAKFGTLVRQVPADSIESILLSPNVFIKLVVVEVGEEGLMLLIRHHSRGFHEESVPVDRKRTFASLCVLANVLLNLE
jgi:hypothetical protein